MPAPTITDRFTAALFDILDETFERHHGLYLDSGTSLFETLAPLSAGQASRPVGGRCASLAAQVKHVSFYLEVLEAHILQKDLGRVDWDEIWRTTEAVTPAEWAAIQGQLRETYQRVLATLKARGDWLGEDDIAGALAIVAHTAYHLGEIRQALCVIPSS